MLSGGTVNTWSSEIIAGETAIRAEGAVTLTCSDIIGGSEPAIAAGEIVQDTSYVEPALPGVTPVWRIPQWQGSDANGIFLDIGDDPPASAHESHLYWMNIDLEPQKLTAGMWQEVELPGFDADTPGEYTAYYSLTGFRFLDSIEGVSRLPVTVTVMEPDKQYLVYSDYIGDGRTMVSLHPRWGEENWQDWEDIAISWSEDDGETWEHTTARNPHEGVSFENRWIYFNFLEEETLYLIRAEIIGGKLAGTTNTLRHWYSNAGKPPPSGGDRDGGDREGGEENPPTIPVPPDPPDETDPPVPPGETEQPQIPPPGAGIPRSGGDRSPSVPDTAAPATAETPALEAGAAHDSGSAPEPAANGGLHRPESAVPLSDAPPEADSAVDEDTAGPRTADSTVGSLLPPESDDTQHRQADGYIPPIPLMIACLVLGLLVVAFAILYRRKESAAALLAVGVSLLAFSLFQLSGRYDNKYTWPRHPTGKGVTALQQAAYVRTPLLYLVDGWAYYDGLLLPEEARAAEPDDVFYLGRYGGFDLGDPQAAPHGAATYRMVIEAGDEVRDYSLELTRIYSRWRLWINGELRHDEGMSPAGTVPEAGAGSVTFRASGDIELGYQVADDTGYYSGMVYPPAFGSPAAVDRMLVLRMLSHCLACVLAGAIGLLCLFAALRLRYPRPYFALTCLCACLIGCTAYPLLEYFGLSGSGWLVAERFCYYGIFACLLWMQGKLCGMPKKLRAAAMIIALSVCGSVLIQPLLQPATAAPLYLYSRVLEGYKWLTAVYLIAATAWSLRFGKQAAGALLCGFGFFAAALLSDRLLPLHEPVLLGWPVEMAGFVIAVLAAVLLLLDTARLDRAYRESKFQLTENRMSAMLGQIRPHFIFNSLASIKNMIEGNPGAEKAIVAFSKYLRVNIDAFSRNKPIPFAEELKHVEQYLWLEKLRFEEDLEVVYDIRESDFTLPVLTLQPIVENAVLHGVARKQGKGTVAIRTERTEKNIRIIVSDNGVGFDPAAPPEDGRKRTGIDNVRERLEALCDGSLTVNGTPGQGTEALIEIPIAKESRHENEYDRGRR